MNILTINAGSSSIKFKFYRYHNKNKITLLMSGQVSQIKTAYAILSIDQQSPEKSQKFDLLPSNPYLSAIDQLRQSPKFNSFSIDCVINRVAHGGDDYKDIILLHAKTISALGGFAVFAPLDQEYNLLIAQYFIDMYPNIKHYACFDTGFHQTASLVNKIYALPVDKAYDSIKSYGFHGLSHSYVAWRLSSLVDDKLARGRWIIAHLGSSSSLCGIKNGKCVVTSKGITSASGLPTPNYSGELDPALIGYLKGKYNLDDKKLNQLLYEESGLYGLSGGISGDMSILVANKDPQAKFAVEVYTSAVASSITKFATLLGGMQGIVFTGGIGENSPELRTMILEHLEWLDISVNKKANNGNKVKICKKNSPIKVLIVPTNEEFAMVNQFIEHKL